MLVWCVLVNITPASWRQQTLSVAELSHVQSVGRRERRNKKVINGSGLTIIITWNVLCVWVVRD